MDNSEDRKIFTPDFWFIALCFAIGLAGFGYVLIQLPGIADLDRIEGRTAITGAWKYGLIVTHTMTFALIPVTMRIFYEGLNNLLKDYKHRSKSIFASQLGLGFIMVAIASEIGWHVTQRWYYTNDFTMLNFMFYFFLISAFALWAGGLVEEETIWTRITNGVFAIGLLITSILYPIGYKVSQHHDAIQKIGESTNTGDAYKIPIYVVLTLVFLTLTIRGGKLLKDWRIIFVPLLSVGVNLTFIFLLDKYGGNPYTNVQIKYNALFHILHDLLGTLAGVAVFAWLVYDKGIAKFKAEESES